MKAMENALGKPDEVYRPLLSTWVDPCVEVLTSGRSDTERACPPLRYSTLPQNTWAIAYVQQHDQ